MQRARHNPPSTWILRRSANPALLDANPSGKTPLAAPAQGEASMNRGLEFLGRSVVRFITRGKPQAGPVDAKALARLEAALRPGDVLLGEGHIK
eukprot:gene28783-37130_t